MKIAVLSRNPRLYSTRRLVEAGRERGHEMVVIDTLRAYMNIASHKPQIHYRGQPLEGFDAVIPRIGASYQRQHRVAEEHDGDLRAVVDSIVAELDE